jgi:hypothetical protein
MKQILKLPMLRRSYLLRSHPAIQIRSKDFSLYHLLFEFRKCRFPVVENTVEAGILSNS